MKILTIVLTALALSMDAFAVSVCKGLATRKVKPLHMMLAGAWFGGFQALMPTVGYLLGASFKEYIAALDHWIAFVLLLMIGANMIREAFSEDGDGTSASYAPLAMLLMAVATSVDAFAVGITFALSDMPILPSVLAIGAVTFLVSALGVKIGCVFGAKYKSKAEIAGGVILMLLAVKFLLEGVGAF